MSEIQRSSVGLKFHVQMRPEVQKFELKILDQRKLPDEEVWVSIGSVDEMIHAIKTLAVRGAPLIGVAAAVALAQSAFLREKESCGFDGFEREIELLRKARPTAVNLMWATDRQEEAIRRHKGVEGMEGSGTSESSLAARLLDGAIRIFDEDVEMCEEMGRHGAGLIDDGESILTICNTGGLATVGKGTAFSVIKTAHDQGKKIHVYACETRPLLQGGRLTTWELEKNGIPHTLITDSMAASLMQQGKIHCVFVGADRVSRRGDFANKIGTYSLAVQAHFHRISFYPVAPFSTVDLNCESGADIEIEERNSEEVRGFVRPEGAVRWAPQNVSVYNPAFDVTPVEFVTRIVLNTGVYMADEFQKMVSQKIMLRGQ